MSKIIGIKIAKGHIKGVKVFLDGEPALNLLAETARQEKLKVGQDINRSRLETLEDQDRFQRCLNAAFRLLGYRPRSEKELRQRLQRHGLDGEYLEKAIARLKEQGLIDDIAFARFWKENRETFNPRSRRMTRLELKRKGLDNDIIEQVIGEIDDGESAYQAATKRAPRLAGVDYQEFRQRLGAYLGRRGFGYSVIEKTTERVWKEQKILQNR